MLRPLVLASASPARLRLLQQAGFVADVLVSGADETVAVELTAVDAERITVLLATRKAEIVASGAAGPVPAAAIVVGCDSMFAFDGELLGKPSDADDARRRWQRMRGRMGTLVTGHCVIDTATGAQASAADGTVVHFAAVTDDEIDAYVATGEPLAVAGAFTLDGRSAPFVVGVDGDPGTVIGLSLPTFRRLLGQLGLPITDLWVAG